LFIEPMNTGGVSELRQLGTSLVTDDRNGWGWKITAVANGIDVSGGSNGSYERVPRRKLSPAPPEWKSLFGEYGWDYNVLRIFERNNQLTALLEMDFNPLARISGDVWQFADDSAYDHEQLKFVLDKSGCPAQVKVGEVVFPRRSPCSR
jgi:hypothetical protein